MSEIFQKRVLGFFPLNITIPKDLIHDPNDAAARDEYWDRYSFCNINDLNVRCLLEHRSEQEVAKTGRGSLRLWVSNRGLHAEILPEPGNAINENLFFRMQSEPDRHYGLSPGYHSGFNEKIMADGALMKRVQLSEISLTTRAANEGSTAVLETDFSMSRVMEEVSDHWRWLNEQKASSVKKTTDALAQYGDMTKDFRIYLSHQKAISEVKELETIQDDSCDAQWIADFKANHPRFQRSKKRGYETAVLR